VLGFKGSFVDDPERLASAWQEALASDRPVVLEVKTDPDVPPLPPHVTFKEARCSVTAMAKGDRSAGRVIGDTARQVVDGLLGRKSE
jgi:pyruvate dehydrogenase (quinone)